MCEAYKGQAEGVGEGNREFCNLIAEAGTYFQVDPAQKKTGGQGGRKRERGEGRERKRAETSGNAAREGGVSTLPAIAAQVSLQS